MVAPHLASGALQELLPATTLDVALLAACAGGAAGFAAVDARGAQCGASAATCLGKGWGAYACKGKTLSPSFSISFLSNKDQ